MADSGRNRSFVETRAQQSSPESKAMGKTGNQRRRVLLQLPSKLAFAGLGSCEQAGKRVTARVQTAEQEQRGSGPDPAPPPPGTAPVRLCRPRETTAASPCLCLTELVMLCDRHQKQLLQHFDFCSPFSSYNFLFFCKLLIWPGRGCGEIT